jgi:hypothetical protein
LVVWHSHEVQRMKAGLEQPGGEARSETGHSEPGRLRRLLYDGGKKTTTHLEILKLPLVLLEVVGNDLEPRKKFIEPGTHVESVDQSLAPALRRESVTGPSLDGGE